MRTHGGGEPRGPGPGIPENVRDRPYLQRSPPGAHVYCGGEYWGETSASQPIIRVFWNNGNRSWADVVLKKRGYKSTNYHMVVRLEYSSQPESEAHPTKIVIVLDTE